jgi:hypothetical protein
VRTFRRSHRYELKPTKEPATISHARPSHETRDTAENENPRSSPAASATARITPPPTSCCIPLPSSGVLGSGALRAYSEPAVQQSVAPTATSIPPRGTFPAAALVPTNTAAPTNPPISPTTTRQPSGALRRITRSHSASHSGISAMINATIEVGVPMLSDTATRAFPPSSRNTPTTAAAFHCAPCGRSPLRHADHANSTVPANRNRIAAPSSVGMVSLTFSMPRYVVPHTK